MGVTVRGMTPEGGHGSRCRERTLTTSDFAAADLDLDVADEQLLAADGVLTLGKCSSRRTVIIPVPAFFSCACAAPRLLSALS